MVTKTKPIYQALNELLGGDWKWNKSSRDWEDGQGGIVCWVKACSSYCDDDVCLHPPQLWKYGHGDVPQHLSLIEPLSKAGKIDWTWK